MYCLSDVYFLGRKNYVTLTPNSGFGYEHHSKDNAIKLENHSSFIIVAALNAPWLAVFSNEKNTSKQVNMQKK